MSLPTLDSNSSSPPADAAACVINCAVYRDGVRQDIPLDRISDELATHDDSFVWVGLYEPDEQLLDRMQQEFGLHDLAVEDAHSAHQRPKLEAFGTTLFMAVHTAQLVDAHVRFGETHIFYGPRFLLTVRHGASLSFAPVRQKLEREPEHLKLGPAVALHGVLDFIVDNYEPIVGAFRKELDELEHAIFAEDFRRQTISRLYALRKELTEMRMSVLPMQDILKQLVRIQDFGIPDEVRPYFRDISDHAARTADTIDVLREMAAAAMNTNLSLVTISQGEVVKKLAGWAGLLAVPTLVASWYGMNFHGMPELAAPHAYWILIGIVSVSCIVLYRYLKKVHWL
ncbi:Mg2+ and Co2+ transporter [Lysobacter silvestris]|uniref:Mg2+ and Co2+ transporter n=2 Tax=Solilutibacter silvestris TaxID=1645665 RepID=A0A2K1Q360_9GAMM|nr:magnesium and cobalt transport protein CorA [Lysobacter silvestris]PNS09431.1 Mg2+ and Co2+ transporter [Lysobacter silvestris]